MGRTTEYLLINSFLQSPPLCEGAGRMGGKRDIRSVSHSKEGRGKEGRQEGVRG